MGERLVPFTSSDYPDDVALIDHIKGSVRKVGIPLTRGTDRNSRLYTDGDCCDRQDG